MIVVHHLNSSRSWRVLWLLEELGLPYQIKNYQRDPRTMRAPAELRAIHPLGKAPVISDGGAVIAESGAIIEYLVERYGEGKLAPPAGTPERLRYRYWLHFAEGTAMPPLLLSLVFAQLPRSPMPFFARPIVRSVCEQVKARLLTPMTTDVLDFMEGELGKSTWFAGEAFSAADIQLSFPIEAYAARAGLDASRPRLWAWLQRIHERPAFKRVEASAGPLGVMK